MMEDAQEETPHGGRRMSLRTRKSVTPRGGTDTPSVTPAQQKRPARPSLAPSAAADTVPRAEYAAESKLDTLPRDEYQRGGRRKGPSAAAAATRARGTAADAAAAEAAPPETSLSMPGVQIVAVDDRRRSRKSFVRSVSHPRSPCARAANAGIGVDAKDLLSGSRAKRRRGSRFVAVDAYGQQRAVLDGDGCFRWADGRVLGYFAPDGSVGSPEEEYLGSVRRVSGVVTQDDTWYGRYVTSFTVTACASAPRFTTALTACSISCTSSRSSRCES